MIASDSVSAKSPSRISGVRPRGLSLRYSGVLCSPFSNEMRCGAYATPFTSAASSTRHENGLPLTKKISTAIAAPVGQRGGVCASARRRAKGAEQARDLRGTASRIFRSHFAAPGDMVPPEIREQGCSEMKGFKEPSPAERQAAAMQARKAALEK